MEPNQNMAGEGDLNVTPAVEQNNTVAPELEHGAVPATGKEDSPKQNVIPTGNDDSQKQDGGEKKKGQGGLICAMILVTLLAAGGIGFGVWAMMDGNQQKEELNLQISSLKKQNSELMEKIDNSTDTMDDVTDKTVDTKEYIYVGEWGVKIQIPEGLSYVEYEYRNEIDDGNNQYSSDYSTISVIAVPSGTDKTNTKEFYRLAKTGQNYSSCYLASVGRMSKDEAEIHGSVIFSDESYNYVFFGGQVPCVDTDTNQEIGGIEQSARTLINSMLSDSKNYSAI